MPITPHLHIGAVEFLVFLLYLIIAGALIRIVEIKCANSSFGKALSFIY
jgi:hypothetical protein